MLDEWERWLGNFPEWLQSPGVVWSCEGQRPVTAPVEIYPGRSPWTAFTGRPRAPRSRAGDVIQPLASPRPSVHLTGRRSLEDAESKRVNGKQRQQRRSQKGESFFCLFLVFLFKNLVTIFSFCFFFK